ncbi:inositol monophosphatase (plasmid) [Thioclava sp. 'Guangxiensis']|uniref:inositol monophosphatase family protein n=1 Tax=Thioclava sp. 'Guangxiensis' TaxID=3149044 RepID=UPI0032C4ABB7
MTQIPDLDAREAFLSDMMARATALALNGFRTRNTGDFSLKGAQDFLTETDLAVEALIRAEIAERFPQDAILGEEGGGTPAHATWVIDPIDGTANFARGVPHFCVIVAFCLAGEAVLAAIHQPVTGERWQARRGHGCSLNGAPVRVTRTPDMGTACLEMGWSRRHPLAPYLQAQEAAITAGANIRRSGSGGLALAYVASGRSDGYLEISMNSWDCVAGLLMVREAGGVVAKVPEGLSLLDTRPVLAATPGIAAQMAGISGLDLALIFPAEEGDRDE